MTTPEPESLASLWEHYEANCVPPHAHAVQRQETKRAFYGGCAAVLKLAFEMGAPGVDEADAVEQMASLMLECRAFAANLIAERN